MVATEDLSKLTLREILILNVQATERLEKNQEVLFQHYGEVTDRVSHQEGRCNAIHGNDNVAFFVGGAESHRSRWRKAKPVAQKTWPITIAGGVIYAILKSQGWV